MKNLLGMVELSDTLSSSVLSLTPRVCLKERWHFWEENLPIPVCGDGVKSLGPPFLSGKERTVVQSL